VWVAGENGSLYVWTAANSWKVKRIRNNGRLTQRHLFKHTITI